MKKVFVSGPYSAPTEAEVEINIRRCEEMAIEVAKLGAAPVCLNPLGRAWKGEPSYEQWMKIAFCLIDTCDAMLVLPGWQDSSGCRDEVDRGFMRNRMMMFYSVAQLKEWLEGNV